MNYRKFYSKVFPAAAVSLLLASCTTLSSCGEAAVSLQDQENTTATPPVSATNAENETPSPSVSPETTDTEKPTGANPDFAPAAEGEYPSVTSSADEKNPPDTSSAEEENPPVTSSAEKENLPDASSAEEENPPDASSADSADSDTSEPTPNPYIIRDRSYYAGTEYSKIEKPGETLTRLTDFTVPDGLIDEFSYKQEQFPQLYARYQGTLSTALRYIIDLIQLEDFSFPSEHPVMLSIRLYPRFSDITDEHLVQSIEIPLQSFYLDPLQGIVVTDLNGDEKDDFIIDLGVSTSGRSSLALFFVYDTETGRYKMLDALTNAAFYQDEMLIYECDSRGSFPYFYKYSVEGSSLVLQESLNGTIYFYNTQETAYTLKKRVDGELVTIQDHVPEDQIDFTAWHFDEWYQKVK